MEIVRVQRLAQVGIVAALGAMLLGLVGVVLAWMGAPAVSAAILVAPGALLLVAAAYAVLESVRRPPAEWPSSYRRVATIFTWTAGIAAAAVIIATILALTHGTGASTAQTILIALLGMQGSVGLILLARYLAARAR